MMTYQGRQEVWFYIYNFTVCMPPAKAYAQIILILYCLMVQLESAPCVLVHIYFYLFKYLNLKAES